MLRNITNTSVNVKMLSATWQCYLPLHSHSPYVICHTAHTHAGTESCPQFMLQININSYKYLLRKFLRFLFILEGPKSTSRSDHIYSHWQDHLGSRDKIYLDLTKIYVYYKFMEAIFDTNFKLNCSQQRILCTRCHRLTVGLSRHARVARKKREIFIVFFAQSRTLIFFNNCRQLH
jgi:hypothetical protein